MEYKPHDYQRRATEFVITHPESLLALDMGLGKSVITLTAIRELIDDCEVEKVLVVAPKKVAETTWTTEAAKWDHLAGLRVVRVLGDEKHRVTALNTEADIYVTGRDNFVWLVAHYGGELPFDMMVLDELTSFKNHSSQRFKAMRIARPSVCRVVGLTGTPAPNGLIDLWGQMYCIDMGQRLGKSQRAFREQYFDTYTYNNIPVRSSIKNGCDQMIRDLISDITITMQARDYLTLPQKLVHTVIVDLSASILKKYRNFEREKILEFKEQTKDQPQQLLANSAAGLMNKLAQFANGAVYDDEHNAHEIHGEKLDKLCELVDEAASPVLVFYQFKHDIPRIRTRLKGRNVEVYQGPAQLERWNMGQIDVLLAHPASTAYGLNMQQGGHYIVWFGTGWDLELYQQANARLYRQGQKYPVTIYKLVAGGTVDQRANDALEGKRDKQQALLDALSELIKKYEG